MSYSSQAGQVLFRTQDVQGTYNSDTGTDGVSMKLRSGGLAPNRDLLVTDPEIGGGRDVVDAYLGAVSWSGDYEFYVRLESLPTLLNSYFGETASALATGVNTHTITPSDNSQLPYLSIEEMVGNDLDTYHYVDGVVNTVHLEAEANGYLMGTVGIIATRQTDGKTPTATPSTDDSPMIVGTNITVTYNSVTLPAKSFNFDATNNYEDDDFRLGSFYLGDFGAKRREITASVTLRPNDASLFRQSTYGGSSLHAPGGTTAKNQLVITCSTYESIAGSSPLTPSSLSITIPKAAIEPFGFNPSGDDIIETDINFRALRPISANDICTVVVKNGRADFA